MARRLRKNFPYARRGKISLARDKIFREKIAHQLAGAAWRAPRRREKFCMRMLETGRADLHVHAWKPEGVTEKRETQLFRSGNRTDYPRNAQ